MRLLCETTRYFRFDSCSSRLAAYVEALLTFTDTGTLSLEGILGRSPLLDVIGEFM